MALFGIGTKKSAQGGKTEEQKTAAPAQTNISSNVGGNVAHVLKNPRITEKASMHQSIGVYTFDVASSATKSQIAAAVRSVYKVSPRKIRVVQVPAKMKRSARTGKGGLKIGGKKAYVYLKSGETITIA